MSRFAVLAAALLGLDTRLPAQEAPRVDPRYPFRINSANAHLPWYRPKPGEFPPHHSDRRIGGELVSADFILRKGQFRASGTGERVDFTMPPYGAVNYLNAEADLRDVPLGTHCLFFLNLDADGGFTRLTAMLDEYTIDAGHAFTYRLDAIELAEGKLRTTKHSLPKKLADLGKKELAVTDRTRVWKGGKPAKLADLAAGDELLFNLTGKTATDPGRCTDIWAGAETHAQATEQQRKKFAASVKFRGLPGWIDRTEGNELTVTPFSGEPKSFERNWMADFTVGQELRVVVANDELRTWNPGPDNERARLLEVQRGPEGRYGSSGVRLVMAVGHMLEGFRKGRVVRVFGPGWPYKDQPYGEGLMNYGYGRVPNSELVELAPKEYPGQFPFRTDYGNDHLPWYRPRPGVAPPQYSEHLVLGELVKVGADRLSGQFRADRSGESVDFHLLPGGTVRYLNADVPLSDLPPGLRYRFHLFQDEKGAFSRVSFLSDELSYRLRNATTFRIESMELDVGKLSVALQLPRVKNYDGDMVQPPDIGRTELRVDAGTRVWKGDKPGRLGELAAGDSLLVNLTGESPGKPSRCSDLWVGAETHALFAERPLKKSVPLRRRPMERTKP